VEKLPDVSRWLGTGIYTIAEAARLTGLSSGRVRRWVKGYEYRRGAEIRVSPPVIRSEHADDDGVIVLSFKDLIELRCVLAFLEKGVRWPLLRTAHSEAAKLLETDYPFATRQFMTDGRSVLMRVRQQTILDIVERQFGFYRILAAYLLDAVDFQDDLSPVRWWPLGRKNLVVIDAERSFGQPIVARESVPTAVLHHAYLAESKDNLSQRQLAGAKPSAFDDSAIQRVASWFSVERRSVRAAVTYEIKLAA
jgi:hypothetical protein